MSEAAASYGRKAPTHLSIGEVRIPLLDYAVARTGILGITKSGKTYGAKGIAEQLLDARIPVVVFDAIGVWRFIKTPAATTGGRGYPVVIAGGAAPDLPLTPESAPEIVRAAIKENISLVIDLYDPKLSKADWRRIVQRCFRTLLYENKGTRHVFLEEAAEYAPQKIYDADTYAEVEKLARMGGNVKLGITIINQRAQEVNKAVLELCDNLVLLRQRGSNAIAALEKWLDRVAPDTAREITKALPHMTQGEAWVWAEDSDHPIRTRTGPLRSFHPDRRATQDAAPPRAAVDTKAFVNRLGGELTALIERAKADDPREMRKQIGELQRQLTAAQKAAPVSPTDKAPKLDGKALKRAEALVARCEKAADKLSTLWETSTRQLQGGAEALAAHTNDLRTAASEIRSAIGTAVAPAPVGIKNRNNFTAPRHESAQAAGSPAISPRVSTGIFPNDAVAPGLTEPQQRIVDVAAMLEQRGIAADRKCIARWLAIHPKGGSYGTNLGALRSQGYLDGHLPTEKGRRAARPLATGIDGALDALPDEPKRNILRKVIELHPRALTRIEMAAELGLHPKGGSYGTNIGWLRTMKVIAKGGAIAATDGLFR